MKKKVYVVIEYYVDDEFPRINEIMVFKKKKSAEQWKSEAHDRDIHEAYLE